MTKAEEAALLAYPDTYTTYRKEDDPEGIESGISPFPNTHILERKGFVRGYEQAEKDIGWISVKDRLPETPTFVFTCIKYDGVPNSLGINFYENGKWWGGIDEEFNWPIEYWMPIPKLPKK